MRSGCGVVALLQGPHMPSAVHVCDPGLHKPTFSVPIGPWLLQELRPWAESQWDYVRRELGEWLEADAVAACWQAHQRGAPGQVDRLWAVLMFAAWHQRWQRRGGGA